jgi:hypothetical protein
MCPEELRQSDTGIRNRLKGPSYQVRFAPEVVMALVQICDARLTTNFLLSLLKAINHFLSIQNLFDIIPVRIISFLSIEYVALSRIQ